jgi:hypothetical protein
MASIYGTSGAWKEVLARLEPYQLKAERPEEIELLLQSCNLDYRQQFDKAKSAIENEIVLLGQDIDQEREKVRVELEKFAEEHALEIKQAEVNVDFYRNDRSIFNSVRSFFRIRRETGKLEGLHKTIQEYRDEIEHELRAKEAQLEQITTTKEHMADAACREVREKVEVLKSIISSAELANAVAELEMIQILSRLPENFHVLNDVHLQAERGIRFEGEWLSKGVISNLVVCPAGVFAIEVYRAGKQAAPKDKEPDPREKIKRVAHLCYSFLKTEFPAVSVRSILAYRGHLAESQATSVVKALPIPDVPGYINWFKEKMLDEKVMKEIVEYLLDISDVRE